VQQHSNTGMGMLHNKSYHDQTGDQQQQNGQYFENNSVGASFQQQQQYLQQQHQFHQFQQQQQQQQEQQQQDQQQVSYGSLPLTSHYTDTFSNWNSDVRSRGDVERSSSLGGLGWMPSSLSGSVGSANSGSSNTGGGEVELGLELGLGLGPGLGLDPSSGNGTGNGDEFESNEGSGIFGVPSHSDWAALVDVGIHNSQDYSNNDDQFNNQTQDEQSSDTTGDMNNSLRSVDSDEANFSHQELRIQASEFQPNASNNNGSNGSGFSWASNNIS
jgi:hypothetical protein